MITDISWLASVHNRLDASSANRKVVIIMCIDYICIAYICIVAVVYEYVTAYYRCTYVLLYCPVCRDIWYGINDKLK